jgi:CDP-diacylglycerol--glycerol-3-phosphate 3-phosphatidyltransferase
MNLPNIISLSRIFLLAPIIIFFYKSFYLLSLIIFIIAAITDYLDGYLARKTNQNSEQGAILDLLSDKIFVSLLLIWMTFFFDSLLILLSTLLIVSREITISYLRLYLVTRSFSIDDVKADILGKLKTSFQMIGLALVLISPYFSDLVFFSSVTFLMLSAIFSWVSLLNYFKKWYENQN